jgi:hypothetical protein
MTELRIDDNNTGQNIGAVLLQHYDKLVELANTCNCISLVVGNDVWYGSFAIPSAAGFSTPTSICRNSVIYVGTCRADERNAENNLVKVLEQLREWKQTYNTTVTRRSRITTFREDSAACHICADDYEKGDRLVTLECGHQFHSQCVNKWSTHGLTVNDVFQAALIEDRFMVTCPLCAKHTSQ